MLEILSEDECNDTYGRIRMYQALTLKHPEHMDIPSERTVYRIMEEIGISHHPRRKPNGITKADREARKSSVLSASADWAEFAAALQLMILRRTTSRTTMLLDFERSLHRQFNRTLHIRGDHRTI